LTIDLSLVAGVTLATTSKKARRLTHRKPQFFERNPPAVVVPSSVCSKALCTSPATLALVDGAEAELVKRPVSPFAETSLPELVVEARQTIHPTKRIIDKRIFFMMNVFFCY
jgi:hypothetical protein